MAPNDTNLAAVDPVPRPTLAGDWSDDDHAVLESLTNDHAEPPTPAQLPAAPIAPTHTPRKISRLLTVSETFDPAWGNVAGGFVPIMILPADPDRTSLSVIVNTAASSILFGDDAGKLQSTRSAAVVATANPVRDIPHTGPVWLNLPLAAAAAVQVTVIAVTA